MDPFHRFSLYLRLVFGDLPPVSVGRLILPVVFASAWLVLTTLGLPETAAFVWAMVLGQTVHVWLVLPASVRLSRHAHGGAAHVFGPALAAHLGLIAFQVWCADPVASQRILSVIALSYAGTMAWGVWGERLVLDRFVPVREGHPVPLVFRVHLLKLNALVAVLVAVVNESLVAADAALDLRVAILSLLPVALHYFYQVTLRLTCPPLDGPEG